MKAADNSLVSADVGFTIEKRFVPTTNAINTYQLQFNNAIHHPHDGHLGAVSSTGFTIGGETVYLEDAGVGNLRPFILVTGNKIARNNSFGPVDYESGLVTIFNTSITAYEGSAISVKVKPKESNIFGVRNEILLISSASVTTVDNDTNNTTSTVGSIGTDGTTTTVLTDNAIANFGVSSVATLSKSSSGSTTVGTTTSSSISGSSY